MNSKLRIYIKAVRPKTLSASVGPVLVGIGLAGTREVADNLLVVTLIIICALLMQISANLVNDYFDYKNKVDSHGRLGPVRASATGLLSESEIRLAYRSTFSVALMIGAYLVLLGGLPIAIIGILSILFAYTYTGGPYPLSYKGMGELLALLFFGPVAVWGTWYLVTSQTTYLPIVAGFGPGFIALSIMAINNMRDRQTDKSSGKHTLAVSFGINFSRRLPIFGVAMSLLVLIYLAIYFKSPYPLITSFVILKYKTTWKRVLFEPIDKRQNISLAETGQYLFFYSLALAISLQFI